MGKNCSNHESADDAPKRHITLKDIAKKLGVSHVTVSLALRNNPRISEATRTRVQQKATEMGYQPDPMLSALANYRQGKLGPTTKAAVAWINTARDPEELRKQKEFSLYQKGAAATANKMGYRLEEFIAAEIPLSRLDTILKTRGIRGILLSPLIDPSLGWKEFPWSDYATVNLSRSIQYPEAHFVTSAQTANGILAFERAQALGYKRIGFVCEYMNVRFFGIGISWIQRTLSENQQLPLLVLKRGQNLTQQCKQLKNWIDTANPDAIITDYSEMPGMLKKSGYRIPEDIGLATSSVHDTPIDAGIDQKPEEIGRAAARTLVALLNEQNFGIPEVRNEILIEGNWVDGTMLPALTARTS